MPVPVDLSIDTVAVFPTETGSRVIAVVTNRGQQSSVDDSLRVFYVNAADTSDISDLIELIAIPSLDMTTPIFSGFSRRQVERFSFRRRCYVVPDRRSVTIATWPA